MRKIYQFFFFFTLFKNFLCGCIAEWAQCFDGVNTYDSCCYPFTCSSTSNNYGQCQYKHTDTNCIERYAGCVNLASNSPQNCCSGLICTVSQSVASWSSCEINTTGSSSACVSERNQCGGYGNILGQTWDGNTKCCTGLTCKQTSIYYSQCLK